MGYLIGMPLFTILALIVFAVGIGIIKLGEKDDKLTGVLVMIGTVVVWGFIFVLVTAGNMVHQVPAGHEGVVSRFGAIVAQRSDGLQIIAPWESIQNADTRIQTWAFTDNKENIADGAKYAGEGLSSFSEETQDVFINATLNIEVSPNEIQELYRNIGKDYFDKLVPTRVRQQFKNETVKYKAVDIAPNRENIRLAVEENLRKELSKFSIDVVALLIDNIDFNPEFKAAIESKQVATQSALEQKELIKAEEAKAQQTIAAAQGVAEANRLLDASLTPNVIQFQAIQKLADNIQIALIPSGEQIIIDPTTLFGTTSTSEPR